MVTVTIDSFFGYDAEATTLIFDDTTELVVEDVIESPAGERIFVSEIPSSVEITAIRGWDSTVAAILNDNDSLSVVEEEEVVIRPIGASAEGFVTDYPSYPAMTVGMDSLGFVG